MTKLIILRIVSCEDCPYLDDDWCNHPNGSRELIDTCDIIPDSCPLPDDVNVVMNIGATGER